MKLILPFLGLLVLALSGCGDKTRAGSYLVPKGSEIRPSPYGNPESVFIKTPQGNTLSLSALKNDSREAEANSNMKEVLLAQIGFATAQKIQWIRAFTGKRADGVPFLEADYRRLNVGTEIEAAEVVSVCRIYYFPDRQVWLSGLLTKGNLDSDYDYVDGFGKSFAFRAN